MLFGTSNFVWPLIHALIVDMDGVTIDTNPADRVAWAEYARRHGVEVTEISASVEVCRVRSQSGDPRWSLRPGQTVVVQAIESGMEGFGFWWCRVLHDALLWPIHGRYECRTCGRRHPIGW